MCLETECIVTLQGHPTSLILTPIESAYETFYWVPNNNFGPILPRFRDIRAFTSKATFSHTISYSGQHFGMFSLE